MSHYTFGVSTWLWTSPFNTETISLFPKIKKMGFEYVEIPVEDPAVIDVKKVEEALKANGLKAIICGAFGPTRDLTADDTALQKNSLEYIEKSMDMCVAWDAKIFAGPMYSAVGKARLVSDEQKKVEWDRAVKNLYKVSAMAASRGLQIAIEPLNRFETDLINTAEDVVKLVNDINHPAAGVMLDGFHMSIEERDLEKAICLAGDKLLHVQLSENYRGTPGTGQTNWDAIKKGLEKVGYKGTLSIESFTPEVQELAGLVCIWKPLANSQDEFASEGLKFLKAHFK